MTYVIIQNKGCFNPYNYIHIVTLKLKNKNNLPIIYIIIMNSSNVLNVYIYVGIIL